MQMIDLHIWANGSRFAIKSKLDAKLLKITDLHYSEAGLYEGFFERAGSILRCAYATPHQNIR